MSATRPAAVDVRHLSVSFVSASSTVYVLDGVDLSLASGECLGLVGESGSGKSVLVRTILGIHPGISQPVATGSVRILGVDTLRLGSAQRRRLMGTEVAMVFQDPLRSLNPTVRIGPQITESLTNRRRLRRRDRRAIAVRLLRAVGVPDPERRVRAYPGELSGGMRQRVGIAAAIAGEPKILLADEPTTALDVTVQRRVLDLLDSLRAERGMSMILVTHDISLLTGRADRIAVMYAGRIVEEGPTQVVSTAPSHPYTQALVAAVPSMTGPVRRTLPAIPGQAPDLTSPRTGCPFAPRCAVAASVPHDPTTGLSRCLTLRPPRVEVAAGHGVDCWAVFR